MIKIIVKPNNAKQLVCDIDTYDCTIITNNPGDLDEHLKGTECPRCKADADCKRCYLLEDIFPILIYFSSVVSYEIVEIEFHEKNYYVRFSDSGQKIAAIVCMYVMFNSKCEYFGKFKTLLKYYRVNITHDIFMHFVLTTVLLKSHAKDGDKFRNFDIYSEVKRFALDFNRRIVRVLKHAKDIMQQDAAVNALNILISLSHFSADSLKEHYHDLIDEIEHTPLCLFDEQA